MTDKEKIKAELQSTKRRAEENFQLMQSHHAPTSEVDPSDIENMEAIRSLLFGKQNAQINTRIRELENRFEKVAIAHAQRLAHLEKKAEQTEKPRVDELQARVTKLEGQLLQGMRLLSTQMDRSNHEHQIQLFEQVKAISSATLKDFDKLREDLKGDIDYLKQNSSNNAQVGEVLENLGRQLQGDRKSERTTKADDKQ